MSSSTGKKMYEMRESRVKRELLRDEREPDMLIMVWAFRLVLVLLMMAGVCKLQVLPISMKSGGCWAVLAADVVGLVALSASSGCPTWWCPSSWQICSAPA